MNIAHQGIQDRRASTLVPLGAQGNLHDYIPFYFAPRSPMLYSINNNNVEGYTEGQGPIVHIVASAQNVFSSIQNCVFTDGHAIMALSSFYNDLNDLDKIDWDIMESKYWNDTQTDGDRKRRRQAEFLVPDFLPWNFILEIGVMTASIGAWIRSLLANKGINTLINIRRNWYY